MPSRPSPELNVTWKQAAAFRLARHHLQVRAPAGALAPVADSMAGVQAQLASAAQIGLWARVRDLRIADVDAALRERVLVKAGAMRRTLFLLPGKELAVFVRGSARRAEKEIRWALGKGVPPGEIEAAIAAALAVLERPLTRDEIAEQVCRALGTPLGEYLGGGWGSRRKLAAVPVGKLNYPVVELLHLVAARGVVCYGPDRGREPTFVRADAWIPGWQDLPPLRAEDLLLRRYLGAYGPSTTTDFALWAGITLTEARAIWRRAEPDLALVDVEGWMASILREDLGPLAQAERAAPLVHLLPYFDTFLLGHRERDHLVASEHKARVYRNQGWIAPTVLVAGRVAAIWEQSRAGDRLQVKVTPFAPLSRAVTASLRAEVEDLARFLEAQNVDLKVS
jgi:hypothetical protein